MPNLPDFAIEAIKQAALKVHPGFAPRSWLTSDEPSFIEVQFEPMVCHWHFATLIFGKSGWGRSNYGVNLSFRSTDTGISDISIGVEYLFGEIDGRERFAPGRTTTQIATGYAAMKQRKSQLLQMKRRRKAGLTEVETEELGIITAALGIGYDPLMLIAMFLNPRVDMDLVFRDNPAAAFHYDQIRNQAWYNVDALFPVPNEDDGPSAWAEGFANLTNAANASLVDAFGGDPIPEARPDLFDSLDRLLR